jgi:hypothetical protein
MLRAQAGFQSNKTPQAWQRPCGSVTVEAGTSVG